MSDESIKKLYNSICKITGNLTRNGQSGYVMTNAVFLSPSHVLTAWHCLSSITNRVFTNNNGETSSILKGGTHKKNTDLDLAIVELEKPIGLQPACVVNSKTFKPDMEGYIVVSIWNRDVKHYPVTLDTSFMLNMNDENKMASFYSREMQLGPGCSGAPVVNKDGCVISILSAGLEPADVDEHQIFMNSVGTTNVVQPQFRAPQPLRLAKWMDKAYFDIDAPEL